jgi:hypothetical protein
LFAELVKINNRPAPGYEILSSEKDIFEGFGLEMGGSVENLEMGDADG